MMYLFTLIYDVLVYSQIIHSTNPNPNPLEVGTPNPNLNPNRNPNPNPEPNLIRTLTVAPLVLLKRHL